MPVILPREAWPVWLGETDAAPEELLALAVPCPAELMRVYPIGPAVGNVRNDAPELLDPPAPEALGWCSGGFPDAAAAEPTIKPMPIQIV